jgi:hypothetical protein
LNVDDQLRLAELLLEPIVFPPELRHFIGQRVLPLRLATTPLGRQAGQDALVA